jgi:hypothetical protein
MLFVYTVSAATVNYTVPGGQLIFDSATGTVTGFTGRPTNVEIPSQIDNVTVSSIGKGAFNSCKSLTTISIPESVTEIGESAFYCCTGLTTVNISNGVKKIGIQAFGSCENMTNINIPSSVESIGMLAFSWCSKLLNIDADAANAFFTSEDGVLFNKLKTVLLVYPISKTGNYNIPDGVTRIDQYAFCGSKITGINIPSSVKEIGVSAFISCEGLTSVVIPEGLAIVGYAAFSRCSNLTSVSIPQSVIDIGQIAFNQCTKLTEISIAPQVKTND